MDFSNHNILTRELKKGNHESFTYLVDTYHQSLCSYANTLTGDKRAAEDIVQNVFLRFWKKRDRMNIESSIKSFLYRSVYNEFIDDYRKSQSFLKFEKIHIEYLNQITTDEDMENTVQLIKVVKTLIEELPPKCKEVFALSKREGLTNVEISEHLGLSLKGVEAQITRGFKILRKKHKEKYATFLFFLLSPYFTNKKKLDILE